MTIAILLLIGFVVTGVVIYIKKNSKTTKVYPKGVYHQPVTYQDPALYPINCWHAVNHLDLCRGWHDGELVIYSYTENDTLKDGYTYYDYSGELFKSIGGAYTDKLREKYGHFENGTFYLDGICLEEEC